jgi:hypothetical protein
MLAFSIPLIWSRRSNDHGATGQFLVAEIRDAGADGAGGRGLARLCGDPVPDQRNPRRQSGGQRAAGVSRLHRSGDPKFSQPNYDTIKAGGRDERVQYESFVSYFLYACEEAIAAFASRPEWLASCNYDLKPHLPFLCEKNSVEPAYLATYSSNTQQWVRASLQTASVTPPDCKLGKT